MPEASLQGRRGSIVEDDYFLAENMRADFEREGEVISPIGRVSDALSLVASSEPLYGAVLDIIVASILSCLVMNSLK